MNDNFGESEPQTFQLILDNYITAQKVSKYGVFSGPYFVVFSPNTGKYGPVKTPYLDSFHEVYVIQFSTAKAKVLRANATPKIILNKFIKIF